MASARQLPEPWGPPAAGRRPGRRSSLLSVGLAGLSVGFHDFVLTVLLNLILVVGMYIFIGNSGVLSFGHISFMALGAYAAALVSIPTAQKQFVLPESAALSRRRPGGGRACRSSSGLHSRASWASWSAFR